MKNLFAMTAALLMGFGASANNVELVVEAVDNGGVVPGNTYRVYAVLPSAQHSLHAIFAADEHVLNVATTGSFFQHQYGSSSSLDVNEAIVGIDQGLAFDSWVTVGADNSENNNLWTIGIDYTNFLAGTNLLLLTELGLLFLLMFKLLLKLVTRCFLCNLLLTELLLEFLTYKAVMAKVELGELTT